MAAAGHPHARAHDPRPRRRHRRAGGRAASSPAAGGASRVGIDVDPAMLALAANRLWRPGPPFTTGSLPARAAAASCDAAVASFSLHHIRTRAATAALYRRVHAALGSCGASSSASTCQPAGDAAVSRPQRDAWLAHLRRSYTRARARRAARCPGRRRHVCAPRQRARADAARAASNVEVAWRRGAFAVLRGARRRSLTPRAGSRL